MFRKLILVLGATATLAVAALTPTTASAWHHHRHWGFGWGGYYAPAYVGGPYCYTVKRVVETPAGPRVRRFTVCD